MGSLMNHLLEQPKVKQRNNNRTMAMSTDRRNIKVQDDGTINGDGGKLQPNYTNSSAIQNRMEQKAHKYYTTAASKKPIQHASRLFS